MNSWKLRSLVVCSALTAVMLFSSDAQAGWRHYAKSYGGCYGCYGGSIGYGSYGSWGCYGGCYTRPVGHLKYRWRSHHYAYYGGWGSYGCYGGSYGCCGGCYVVSSCGCCGGSYGGSYGGDVYYSPSVVPEMAPVGPDEPTPADPPAVGQPLPDQQTLQNGRDALLTVSVPKGAQIFVNGSSTRSTGETRRYVSRNLNPGYAYTYEVRAEMDVNGEMVERTKTVRMKAGQTHDVAFNFDVLPAPETVLTLNVPEDADVYLAGNKTRGNGKVRTFRTTKLADGQTWDDYAIRVTVNRNGQELSKEERISLNAGDSRELTIDVDGNKLAIAR